MPVFPLIAPQQLKYAKIKRMTPAIIKRIGNDVKESSEIAQNYISIIANTLNIIYRNYQEFRHNLFECELRYQLLSSQIQ